LHGAEGGLPLCCRGAGVGQRGTIPIRLRLGCLRLRPLRLRPLRLREHIMSPIGPIVAGRIIHCGHQHPLRMLCKEKPATSGAY
jgi:hypothetical protein